MKKYLVGAMLGISILATGMAGCNGREKTAGLRPGMAEHEILTFNPVPEDKLLITMRGADNINGSLIEEAIEAQFPNVEIVLLNNTHTLDLKAKNIEDIYLTAFDYYLTKWGPEDLLIDLSNQPFVNNYYPSALNDCKYQGGLYYLPGPSTIQGIVYDKQLFKENGWEVPHSLTEFEELCGRIQETGLRAYQPSLIYHSSVKSFFAAFNYSTVFAGIDNIAWLQDYRKGEAGMSGHMGPAFERMERLLELEIYQPADFTVSPFERSKMMYYDHTCAMIQEGLSAVGYSKDIGGDRAHELGIMPFWSGDGPDDDFVINATNFYIAASKKLEEPGNEEKLKTVLQILEYLSTPKGQEATMLPESPMIGSLKGSSMPVGEFAADILETLKKGNQFSVPVYGKKAVDTTDIVFTEYFRAFSEGTASAQEVMAACDKAQTELVNAKEDAGLYSIGTAEEDFTVLETSEYIADIFRRKTGADIGLCRANTRQSGCNAKLYKGDILNFEKSADSGTSFCYDLDRGFGYAPIEDENGPCLLKVTMTGSDILAALNEVYNADKEYPADYIVSSGLKIEFAPWAGEGKRVRNITLADGSELEPEQMYSVAFWNGTVDPKRIKSVDIIYESSFLELFEEAVREDGTIAPFHDERFVLDWSIIEGE